LARARNNGFSATRASNADPLLNGDKGSQTLP
jgi:hypothetical protein